MFLEDKGELRDKMEPTWSLAEYLIVISVN